VVQVRRIRRDERWIAVEQGRQWLDELGRHVLVMIDGRQVHEIVLDPGSLRWKITGDHDSATAVA
jgi:hypothetical protein